MFSCRESHELIVSNVSTKLIDFSYEMNSKHGLLYFVTDYSIIELLVSQLIHLRSLRLYIIGCLNTIITRNRLQNDLLKNLTELEKFCYFIQCYGQWRNQDFSSSGQTSLVSKKIDGQNGR
mgnify:CR=1 FL=1